MTDSRPRHAPRINLSARGWKLYVIGGLGLAYAASLAAIGTRADSAAPRATSDSGQPAVVWLDQLPVTQRPNVSVPPNWTIASTTGQAAIGQSYAPAGSPASGASPRTAAAPRVMTRTS